MYSIFQWGWANNLLEMYCITAQRMTKLATEQGDENKSNRSPQFHGDTARRNEMTATPLMSPWRKFSPIFSL